MKTSNKILSAFFSLLVLGSIISLTYVKMGTSERKPLTPIGPETTKNYNFPYLNTLDISAGEIQIFPGNPKVEITCAENIQEKLEAGFDEGKFYIHAKNNVRDELKFNVRVFTNDLKEIYLYNQASIVKNNESFQTDSLHIEMFNASRLEMDLQVDFLQIKATNAAVINLDGTANFLEAEAYNAGRIEAGNLVVKEVDAYASNAGQMTIHASEKLSTNVSGAGRINYHGNPKIIKKDGSDGGQLNSMDDPQ